MTAKQFVLLLSALIISTAVGYLGYQRFASPPVSVQAAQTTTARLGSMVSTVTTTGSVVATHLAKLSFSADGKLVDLKVSVGANVKTGQLLAQQDTAPLQSKLVSTESALKVAQMNLEKLKAGATADELEAARLSYNLAEAKYAEAVKGPTDADILSAQSAVTQAASNLSSAQTKLDDLKAGPTESDMLSAQAAVEVARAGLASAQAKLEDLKEGPTATDVATAQAAVETARSGLLSAQEKLDLLIEGPTTADLAAAQASVETAKGSMISALDRWENAQNGDLTGGTSSSSIQQAYNSAKANYDSAVQRFLEVQAGPTAADLQSAQSGLKSAQATYDSAVAKLEETRKGPTSADLGSAESSVQQAKASLSTAQVALDKLQKGPTAVDLAAAQSAVDQARASQVGAEASLSELQAGTKESDLLSAKSSLVSARITLNDKTTVKDSDLIQQEESVRQAQASYDQAKLDLDSATITAPFDGIVSAVSANAGEQVASGAAVITLVDPTVFRIDVVVDETDVVKLAVGQPAAVTFDSLPDQRIQGKVISVAPTGASQQGVVTYPVSIGVENAARSFPGGMSAVVNIETERKDNVLLVPSRAVRTQGRNRVVNVLVGETTETRTVQVGSSNDQMIEIVSGLKDGDIVEIPATTIRSGTTNVPGGGMGVGVRAVPAGGGTAPGR